MTPRAALDVAHLPMTAFGHRATIWWGVLGLIAIETTMFAILGASYFYVRYNVPHWPPLGVPKPDLAAVTADLVIVAFSVVPAVWLDRAARRHVNPRVLALGLLVMAALGIASLVCRGFEFRAVHAEWDVNVYGSVTWTILGAHALHLFTTVLECLVIGAALLTRPVEDKHFVDVHVTMLYWYFVVATFFGVYAVVFLAPGWIGA